MFALTLTVPLAPTSQFKDGKMHGRGQRTWPNGAKYDGEYENDLPNGHGVEIFPDGSSFDGNYHDGSYAGLGKLTLSNGLTLDGEFKVMPTAAYDSKLCELT